MIELPCDTEPPAHGPSFYLTLPLRSYAEAVRDISKIRDLPDYVFEELRLRRRLQPSAEIISLAQMRVAMRAKR